ncbi:MAG: hypothetical protein IT580_07420, partial [Verrucomicrobiales bacterium]|nr:hypothetical protein [Verrucomicrobiales bacterium]
QKGRSGRAPASTQPGSPAPKTDLPAIPEGAHERTPSELREMDLESKALSQFDRGDYAGAVSSWDQILTNQNDLGAINTRARRARTLFNKALSLERLRQDEAALQAYDQVASTFGQAMELSLQVQVARALFNKGSLLGNLDLRLAALEVYDQVISRFGTATHVPLQEQVAMALVNKGYTLGFHGKVQAALEAYDQVINKFQHATEDSLREQVARALINRAFLRADTQALECTEADLRRAVEHATKFGGSKVGLGNFLVDVKGDPQAALEIYLAGLRSETDQESIQYLHGNCAYVLALSLGDRTSARFHAEKALAGAKGILSPAGQALLKALPVWSDAEAIDWSAVFGGIGQAVECGDSRIWTVFLDDLQRLLWFVVAQGAGEAFCEWMEAADYPQTQAPLYHAFVAAFRGEDHLLRINPEVRAPAERIFAGLARRLKLYGSSRKPKRD